MARKAGWERDQKKIAEWNNLFDQLGDEKDDFINLIGDNEYLPEKVLGIKSDIQKKMYLLYLTTPRLFALLGMVDQASPTFELIKNYITEECPYLFDDILDTLSESETQQQYMFKNYAQFFGKQGIRRLMSRLANCDFNVDKLLAKWDVISKKQGIGYVDFELVRVYRRFVDLSVFDAKAHEKGKKCIEELDMPGLALILNEHVAVFEKYLSTVLDGESGQKIIKRVIRSISDNIQLKLDGFLEV